MRDRAIAAFVSTSGGVRVFVHPLDGSAERTVDLDGASHADAVALGAATTRAFVTWSDGGALHGTAVGDDGSAAGRAWARPVP